MATTESALSATAAALTLSPSSSSSSSSTVDNYITTIERNNKSITISSYRDETQIAAIMELMSKDLSEPYSIFTYRFFLQQWSKYCLLAHTDGKLVGAILCKVEPRKLIMRGYVGMFAIDVNYRKLGIGSTLAAMAIQRLAHDCDEVFLETEITNTAALRIYENLGFVRSKRLPKYYMNGNDAYRLKCWFSK